MSREDEIRTLEQNKKFHAMCRDFAAQVQWAGDYMDENSWKHLFLAAAHGQKTMPNPFDSRAPFIVANKRRSSGLVVPEMADLITQMQVFGDERGIKWTDELEAA